MLKKKILTAFLILAVVMSFFPSVKSMAAESWVLVWSDEFNGSSLNTSNWTAEIGTGGNGWGNNELQYYTNRPQNLSVSGGNLVIAALKESYGGRNYTSARIKTQGLKSFQYGRFEARIKLPSGQGIWPAFWMLGDSISSVSWPRCGEIDIMERVNFNSSVNGTVHYESNGYKSYGTVSRALDFSQFHTYTVEWDSGSIKWFVDGVQYYTYNIKNSVNGTGALHNKFFLLLNMAVGGNWPGSPDGATVFPAQMLVDYVRVYQKQQTDDSNKTSLADGTYHITAVANDKYVCAEDSGDSPLTADRDTADLWETFTVVNNSDGTISLRSAVNGKYVCAVIDEYNQLLARSSAIDEWEKFEVYRITDTQYALKSIANGMYVAADLNDGGILKARSISVAGAWEAFYITPAQ